MAELYARIRLIILNLSIIAAIIPATISVQGTPEPALADADGSADPVVEAVFKATRGYPQETADLILGIAAIRPDEALALTRMPFLVEIEEADNQALWPILLLFSRDQDTLITETSIWKEGIEDHHTDGISASMLFDDPEKQAQFIRQEITSEVRAYDETRRVNILSRVEAGPVKPIMSDTFRAFATVESVMNRELPGENFIIAVDPVENHPALASFMDKIGIRINRDFDDPAEARNIIAHELAHYFWNGNERWLDEGLATTIAAEASLRLGDQEMAGANSITRGLFCDLRNLQELEQEKDAPENFLCNYSFGWQLFTALKNSTSPERYYQSVLDLHDLAQAQKRRSHFHQGAGIEQVRQAFPYSREIIDLYWQGDPPSE